MKIFFAVLLGSLLSSTSNAEKKSVTPPSWVSNGEESWERGERLRDEKRLTEASDAFLNGCKKHHGESCFSYAKDSERRGLIKRAARFYGYACDHNVTRGCIKSATLWQKRGESNLAAEAYKKGCGLGDKSACEAISQKAVAH